MSIFDISEGVQEADVDAPATLYSTRPPIPRSASAQYTHQSSRTLFLITTADSSPLMPLLLLMLVCEEQARRTPREHMKSHPHAFPRKCQEWHARRVLRGAE